MAKIKIRTNLEVTGALGVTGGLIVSGTTDVQRLLINGQEIQTGSTITNVSELVNDADYQSGTEVSASIAAAVAGFITEEQDPTVFDYIKEITQEDIASWNAKLSSSSLKTVNNQSLVGTGNIEITGSVTSVNGMSGSVVLDLGQYATTSSLTSLSSSVSASIANIKGLPSVTSADNGKILLVVSGSWSLVTPIGVYSGTGTPSSAQGENGDIYLQV